MFNQKRCVSIIIPCLNEQEVINTSYKRLTEVMSALNDKAYELIFIDDGSHDATYELLTKIQQADPHVRLLKFSRNFGHQIAVSAGLDYAAGDAAVIIDADLQDPPEVIPEMITKWEQGFDVVYGKRIKRQGETKFKLFTAKLFYRILAKLTDIPIPLDTGDFRLIDRKVIETLKKMPEKDRFIRGMVAWAGFNVVGLPYVRQQRIVGKSKYPLFKMIKFALDGIMSFSLKPLRLASILGFITAGFALVGMIYALIKYFLHLNVTGWTALFLAILFLSGIQLLMLGVIGEYLGRTYMETKNRPLYLIESATGFEKHE
ncbi:MAG: glycosyltransferase family 2 protein [Gammaproteobacteria bacterium]|jgi:dolichol-phosphate mannosyltransferase